REGSDDSNKGIGIAAHLSQQPRARAQRTRSQTSNQRLRSLSFRPGELGELCNFVEANSRAVQSFTAAASRIQPRSHFGRPTATATGVAELRSAEPASQIRTALQLVLHSFGRVSRGGSRSFMRGFVAPAGSSRSVAPTGQSDDQTYDYAGLL